MKLTVKTVIAAFCLLFSLEAGAQCLADTSFALSTPQIVNDTCKGDANGAVTIRINPLSATSTGYSIFFNGSGPFAPTPSVSVPGTWESQFSGLAANTYQAIVVDNNFCADTIEVQIREPDEPFTVVIDSVRDALCGSNGYIAATTTGGWSNPSVFTWTAFDDDMNVLPGYPRTLGYQLQGLTGGLYNVSATDLRGCRATASVNLVAGLPFEVSIDPPTDQTVSLGDSIDISASVNSGTNITYQWFPTTYLQPLSAANDSVRSKPCSDVTYIVLAIDASRNCSDADSITVSLTGEFDPYIPNIFNPYSPDPRNNVFQAFGPGITDVEMQIFERKGGLIFENPADTRIGTWDGRIGDSGPEAVAGKYLYFLRITSICGETVSRSGGVTLLR